MDLNKKGIEIMVKQKCAINLNQIRPWVAELWVLTDGRGDEKTKCFCLGIICQDILVISLWCYY